MNTQLATEAHSVLSRLIERVDALGYRDKTKKADCTALDYLCGAAIAAQACGNSQLYAYIGNMIPIISVRGMLEVRRWYETVSKLADHS